MLGRICIMVQWTMGHHIRLNVNQTIPQFFCFQKRQPKIVVIFNFIKLFIYKKNKRRLVNENKYEGVKI